MLDKHLIPILRAPLRRIAEPLHRKGVSADQVTVFGFVLGIGSISAVAMSYPLWALVLLLLNRLADGVDGELARLQEPTAAGGFLDITLDFIFYAMFPLGFVLLDVSLNALPAAVLIASFVGTGASFLAFATQAEKLSIVSPDFEYKSLYYLDGLAEGAETILCFSLMCLFVDHFSTIAWIFAFVCLITAVNRVWFGYRTLRNSS